MKNFDTIERYLKDEMEPKEKVDFELKIKEDEQLALEVELQKSENSALENIAFDILKDEIASLDKKGEQETKDETDEGKVVSMKPRRNYSRGLAIAATIALLLFAGYYILKDKIEEEPKFVENPDKPLIENPEEKEVIPEIPTPREEIAQAPKENPEKKPTEIKQIPLPDYKGIAMAGDPVDYNTNIRGDGSEETDVDWKIMLEKFSAKKYSEVIKLVDAMNPDHMYYVDAKQLKAESLFLSSKFKASTKMYKNLIEDGDDFQLDNYEYELLRSLIAQLPDTKSEVDALFLKINSNPDHTYLTNTKQLQNKLKEVGY